MLLYIGDQEWLIFFSELLVFVSAHNNIMAGEPD